MITITNKTECCGCTACITICPKKCIKMVEDNEGFSYPVFDVDSCINCNQCNNVCPVINKKEDNENYSECFLVRTKDEKILSKCTSGGVATSIAKEYADNNCKVFGAIYDENFNVVHKSLNKDTIMKISGSKYVQSSLVDTFSEVIKDAKNNNVIFCGTPCQVYGLNNVLGNSRQNVLLIDFACHGVPSPLLWKKYLNYLKKKGDIKHINFRSKKLGYHIPSMEETFVNNKSQLGSARTNLMLKCYFKNVANREICYECPFKGFNRKSDLTIFDGWHASSYLDNLIDDDKGYTIVLANTDKGKECLKAMSSLEIYEIDSKKAIDLDGSMFINSVKRPPERDRFYQLLNNLGIEKTVNELFPISRLDYIIENLKIALRKTKILTKIKKIMKS